MKPLEAVSVLDLTEGNPYIGSVFADYGATVLKVEKPQGGDDIRRRGGTPEEEGPYAQYYLRGKKSIAIDYTTADGQEIVRKLAAKCDMVAVNKQEDYMERLGLGYENLKAVNPKLIYGVLTPFGKEGPWKDCPDYDLIVMAKCGLLEKTGFPERPTKFGFPLAYIYASWHLTAGMMAAYLKAEESGEGSKVSVSSWHTMMELDDTFAECMQGLNVLPRRLGNGFPTTNPTDTFHCKDGWFALSIGSDKQWLDFAREAGRDDWGEGSVYVEIVDQAVCIFRDAQHPLALFLADNRRAAALTHALNDLFVCQHAFAARAPVDGHRGLVCQPVLVHLEEDPLRPLIVLRVCRVDDAVPVEAVAEHLELAGEVFDVLLRDNCRMDMVLDGEVLGRQAKGIEADGV